MDVKLLLPIAGSVVGVMISAFVAILLSKRQVRNEILKARMQIDATYRAKLFERRLAVYPALAKNLAALGSAVRAGRVPTQQVRETWEVVREWDAENSIFMSPLSMKAMIDLRRALIEYSASSDEFLSNKRARGDLMPLIIDMQLALKTELGVMHADGFHKPERAMRVSDAMADSQDGQGT